jgi:hypothetical protein
MTVQYLLNCVPYNRGGPSTELAVDGIAGPITHAAISRFQLSCLGRADGRIDPGGPTLARLQEFDPYPSQPMPASPSWKQGYKQGKSPGIKDPNQHGYENAVKQPYYPGVKQGMPPGYKDAPPGFKNPYSPGIKQPYQPGFKDASPGGYKQTYPPGYKDASPGGYKQTGPPVKGGGFKSGGVKSGGW